MTISIEEARQIIGIENKKYTDHQIEEIINIFTVLSDLAIDSYLAKRKEKKNGKT